MLRRSGGLALAAGLFFARPVIAVCPGDSCLTSRAVYRGNLDFFATGGTFTFDDDADDRPDGLLLEGSVTIPRAALPPRAEIAEAWLYFGGSLYDDDDGIEAPDDRVELLVPGVDAYVSVQAEAIFESGPIPGFEEVSLFTARADVTDVVRSGASLVGTYRVRGFDADIFDGELEHTAANASFSLVLIYREPRLPPREVVLFDGLETVLGSTVTLGLDGFAVSEIPSGALTVYALEGDCHPGPDRCADGENLSGPERIRVLGADPGRSLILTDALNPPNDIFNRTINTVLPPLTEVVGTDIDRFDITTVLRPGDDRVTVEVTAPRPTNGERGELIGLAYLVVGIDVFAPELEPDSRIEVRSVAGDPTVELFAGQPLDVQVAVSNTGNARADDVSVRLSLPRDVVSFEVRPFAGPGDVQSDPAGGSAGRGRIEYSGLSIRPGEIEGLPLVLNTSCPGPDLQVTLTATVGAPDLTPFVVTSTFSVTGRDVCGPRFRVLGGGGCRGNSTGSTGAWLVLLLVFAGAARSSAVRRWMIAVAVIGNLACSDDVETLDRDAPAELGTPCSGVEGMVLIPSVLGAEPFCIDQYEASLDDGELGDVEQPVGGNGSTTAVATSARFARPASGVSWHQAAAACRNAGKALCTARQWRSACAGESDLTFPYGDVFGPARCNGFSAGRGAVVESGAMIEATTDSEGTLRAGGCVSPFGVYDLSGNVWEWNADTLLGTRRGLAGGSYLSNEAGLSCRTEDRSAFPELNDETFGFRCCAARPAEG